MANPQKENGHTQIANEILENLARIRISGEAYQVLNVILRKTYGFNKKEDAISLSQFTNATGLSKTTLCKVIKKLEDMKLINKTVGSVANVYSFNKNSDSWKPLPKRVTLPKKEIIITHKGNNHYPKEDIQKTVTKDTITKDKPAEAGEIIEVIDSFKEINPSYKKWFGNTTQRKAIRRLVDLHSLQRVLKITELIPKTNKIPFMPTITTPLQLEDKWASLEAGLIKKKAELQGKSTVAFI